MWSSGGCRRRAGRLPRAASAADMEKISTLQEQKGELRKRLSYTTHKLEKLETEFDSTRHYLEIELRRAQEELEKVTEKLRRIQNNYLALQRINQELEDKLYRMGQHYEEEKRALSHEIVALNNHLLEAKVTIDKLSEDNLPSDFQERVSLHMEKHGCGLPAPLCHPSFADTIPTCVISQVLEKPEPSSLSSHLSNASARDLAFRDAAEKAGPRTHFKSDIYCSDTALYCPEERRRDRRPSVDMQVKDVGFLRSQHSTDSTAEEDGFHSSFSHEAFPEYVASLPTSSSYSSFSVTSEEKEHAQASTLTASQQAIYLNSRDEIFNRQAAAAYERPCSPCFATVQPQPHVDLGPEGQATPPFVRTLSPYAGDPFRFPATLEAQQALVAQKLRSESRGAHRSDEELPGRWRSLTVEDIGAYSYPEAGRISPHSFPEQYFTGSPGKKADSRASPIYPSYKADSFSEGDDLSQGQLVDSCFLPEDSNLNLNISPSRPPDQLPAYAPSEAGSERLTVQMCGDGRVSPGPEGSPRLAGTYANVSPASSAASLEPSSMEASPEIHLSSKEPGLHPSLHSKQQQFQRTPSTGLSRKDSLTKAQFYGTLLN
ncbi:brain-enriched guanylate kinase-associated protein isoform X4 [Monodelphis domestica]|uniref:brain-enriched guanylate kinase-associated protein isoform X4 n=1 Tax=Monodelphis domestica TaxID=13616 RepID=UPI0024E1C848|nr:brain-enriched guanylate kinase-associated protein isoform X4 [Monodelphis domestica]